MEIRTPEAWELQRAAPDLTLKQGRYPDVSRCASGLFTLQKAVYHIYHTIRPIKGTCTTVFQTEEHKQLRSNREIIDKEYMKKICEDHHSITESSIYNSNSTISLQLHKQIHIIEYTKKNERKNKNSVRFFNFRFMGRKCLSLNNQTRGR